MIKSEQCENLMDKKRCYDCKHEGKNTIRQGWDGDEFWCECLKGMEARRITSFACEHFEEKEAQ